MIKLHNGDCLEVMKGFDDNSVDAIVTDPPYGLNFMGKKWDYEVPSVEIWKECLRVLKPGGTALIFAGSRTQHRMAVNVEDAGFILKDCIMWIYGSGFPKSLDISKAVDGLVQNGMSDSLSIKKVNQERPGEATLRKSTTNGHKGFVGSVAEGEAVKRNTASTIEAEQWKGYGTALKPAYEIVICAEKPLDYSTQQRIIVENLFKKENQLWALLNVKDAESSTMSNQAMKNALNIAQWSAEEGINILEDLPGQTDMSRLKSTVFSCLNTVSLWRKSLEELWTQESMSTIKTKISQTIELETLKSLLLENTPQSLILEEIKQPGSQLNALPVAKILNAVEKSMNAIQALSVIENVISNQLIKPQAVAGKTLSPDYEPIIVAMKPNDGTYANNALKHGVAGINIDGCRVESTDNQLAEKYASVKNSPSRENNIYGNDNRDRSKGNIEPHSAGRFPANIILDGSKEVVDLFPYTKSGSNKKGAEFNINKGGYGGGKGRVVLDRDYPSSEGSAARFFYTAKASKKERGEGNNHPTVKPLALARYLIRLVKMPGNPVILDNFMGSGTFMEAAELEGVDGIGIERDPDYFKIAENRVKGGSQEPTEKIIQEGSSDPLQMSF